MSSILTGRGHIFHFLRPGANVVDIEDIADALSKICRFTGHTSSFYSVAQHSVLVASVLAGLPAKVRLAGLLHDAAEAYVGDVSLPLKQLLPDYKEIERGVEHAVAAALGFEYPYPPAVKTADTILLATERRDLMPASEPWEVLKNVTPLPDTIVPLEPFAARALFMQHYAAICEEICHDRT